MGNGAGKKRRSAYDSVHSYVSLVDEGGGGTVWDVVGVGDGVGEGDGVGSTVVSFGGDELDVAEGKLSKDSAAWLGFQDFSDDSNGGSAIRLNRPNTSAFNST